VRVVPPAEFDSYIQKKKQPQGGQGS
jgi:hypothetical protein